MRSDSKLGGYRRPYEPQNSYMSNRSSNVSGVHSQHLRKMMQDVEMYPSGFAELLKYEERNIKTFKGQINRQKERVNDDMMAFKTEINHVLEDLRLSLHAHLDRVYQGYIERYAKFKGQLLEINRLKDQIEIECGGVGLPSKNSNYTLSTQSNSNTDTITRMENGVKEIKKYHLINYVAELQKQRILPLGDIQREIIILNQYSNGFYQPKQFQKILQGLKDFVKEQVHRVYDNCHLYIREPDAILFKQQPRILDQVNVQPPPVQRVIIQRPIIQRPIIQRPIQRIIQPSYTSMSIPRGTSQSHVMSKNVSTHKVMPVYGQSSNNIGSPLYGQLSTSQQAVKVNWAQKLNLVENGRFRPSGSQIALCGVSLDGNRLALGFKDGTIQIATNQGQILTTLKQHKASICTLSLIRMRGQNYLVSGSDLGCSSIIIWDINTWQPIQKFENHKAAVTAIIDLQDDTHILSGSYDKKINVYNVQQGRLLYNLPANQTPVTGAIINKNASRVVTCGLDKILNVWQISRNGNKVDTLFLQRKIQNNVLICSMVASAWQNDLIVIGTKDGKIKMINIDKGESYKTIPCSDNYLIEMLLVQRQSKPYYPLVLAWPYKQNKIHIVNSQSGSLLTKTTNNYLQFGCGVSPKCFLIQRGGAVCCVSHSQQNKQVSQFRIEEIK